MRKIIIILLSIMVVFSIILIVDKKIENDKINDIKMNINNIKKHYSTYVITNKDAKLYDEDNNLKGIIYNKTKIKLENQEINSDTKYFYIKDVGYISYKDVTPIDEFDIKDRYKKYIPYNINIVTLENYDLYDENNKKIYTINSSDSYPVLINDYDSKYYFEYNNRLVYILKDDIKEIVESENTNLNNADNITTLCYHRVYNDEEECSYEQLCKSQDSFDKEMKYLKDNDYLSLTMEEMYLYISGKIQIPQNSILITLDDGKLVSSAIEVLEKYNLHATVFIVTGSFNDYESVKSSSLELQSHTNDMHTTGVCPIELSYQQGGGILCLDEDVIMNDLTESIKKLDGAIALAYPFYDYNERAIKLVEKAGFKLAFIGAANTNGRSNPSTNQYKIPRMTIWDTTTFDEYKEIVTN